MLPLEQQRPGQLDVQAPLEIARHQLGGNGCAHVVGDDEDGPRRSTTPQEILDQVGLPEEAVEVIAWLRREPEAEEVEGHDPLFELMLQESPPVV
jgi:hypothetical protein